MQLSNQSFTDVPKTKASNVCIYLTLASHCEGYSFLQSATGGDRLTMNSKPTLPRLMEEGIITKIAPNYHDFGIFLLNDEDGSIIDSIVIKFKEDPNRITKEILKRWLQGRGVGPLTYATLVKILKKTELNVLAQTIESSPS